MAKRGSGTGKGRSKGTSAEKLPRGDGPPLGDYRHHGAKRKNNPPAKIAAEGVVPVIPKVEYAYNPHLPPVLRFDETCGPDILPTLLEKARRNKLTDEEVGAKSFVDSEQPSPIQPCPNQRLMSF